MALSSVSVQERSEDRAVTCWDWACPSRYSSKWLLAWKSRRTAFPTKLIQNKFKKQITDCRRRINEQRRKKPSEGTNRP